MDDYSPIMICAVVLVAFIAGYSIISYVIKRFKSDAARSRGDHDSTQEQVNLNQTNRTGSDDDK